MRGWVIFGAMALVLASVQDAEARGLSGGGSRSGGVGVSSPARSEDSAARRARAAPVAPDPAFLRPILPVRAPVQAAAPAPTQAAPAGCTNGRLVGQGAGFCQLN